MGKDVDDNGPRKAVSHYMKHVIKFVTRNSGSWWDMLERLCVHFRQVCLRKLAHRDCFAIAVKVRSSVNKTKKQPKLVAFVLLVDDNGLEPLTLRTSSACSTS